MNEWIIILIVLIICTPIRIGLHFADKSKLSNFFETKGYSIYDIKWSPFSSDAFLEKNERHYTVRYYDSCKNLHVCICKTSLFTSVYTKEDYIVIKNKDES